MVFWSYSPWLHAIPGYTALWLVLLTLVVFECIRSQKNITSCQGEIRLKPGNLISMEKVRMDRGQTAMDYPLWRVIKSTAVEQPFSP